MVTISELPVQKETAESERRKDFLLSQALKYAKARPLNLHRTHRVAMRLSEISAQIRRLEDTLTLTEQIADFFQSDEMKEKALRTAGEIAGRIRPLMQQAEDILTEASHALRSGVIDTLREDVELAASAKLREALEEIEDALRSLLVKGGYR